MLFVIKKALSKAWAKPLLIVGGVLVVIITGQLLYPSERCLPFRQVDGLEVGLEKTERVAEILLEKYGAQKLTLKNNQNQSIALGLAAAGVEIDVEPQLDWAADYPLWQRFIPLSWLQAGLFPSQNPTPKLAYSGQIELNLADPVDAIVSVENGSLKARPASFSCDLNEEILAQAVPHLQLDLNQPPTLYLNMQINQPAITTEMAENLVAQINSNIALGLDFQHGALNAHADYPTLLSFLEFQNDYQAKAIKVEADSQKLLDFVASSPIGQQISLGKNTIIYTENGVETGREAGQAGKIIDVQQLAEDLKLALAQKTEAVAVKFSDAAPQVVYQRSYSGDWAGMASELAEKYAGRAYAIAFQSLNDPNFNLFVNVDRDFIAASTYKLFAAYSMFKTGQPPSCLDSMIINSENACPLDFMSGYGWLNSQRDAHSIGATSTFFSNGTHTTARDLVTILSQIYRGSLLASGDNERLLYDMKIQRFRTGIPAGIPEATVADKVGFLDGLLHDAAIVYSPKGDFILVILTDGYSWGSIAETARQIYARL